MNIYYRTNKENKRYKNDVGEYAICCSQCVQCEKEITKQFVCYNIFLKITSTYG